MRGTIKINDTTLIPFKIALLKNDINEIYGYSLTDENGVFETKSYIKGNYDSHLNSLTFEEYDIVYSKSPYDHHDFCFIHFNGILKNFEKAIKLKGTFKGVDKDGNTCVGGEIILFDERITNEKILILKERLNSLSYKKSIPKRSEVIDSVIINPVTSNEIMNIYVQSDTLMLSIFDPEKTDNDRVRLYINNEVILDNYSIKNKKEQIPIKINNTHTYIKIQALDERRSSTSTVNIEVKSKNDYFSTKTSLKTNQTATLKLIKKEKDNSKKSYIVPQYRF